MPRVIYNTATTLDGYLADDENSLSWLFVVAGADEAESAFSTFLKGIRVLVMGSTTYEWLLEHEQLVDHPEKWYYSHIVSFVLSTRTLPQVAGADIRFRKGDVDALWPEVIALL